MWIRDEQKGPVTTDPAHARGLFRPIDAGRLRKTVGARKARPCHGTVTGGSYTQQHSTMPETGDPFMLHARLLTATALLMTSTTLAIAEPPILVTNGDDSGAGSLRAALTAATDVTAPTILIVTEGDIALQSGLTYPGTVPVQILGRGQSVTLDANETILAAIGGAGLTLRGLSLQGPGGFSIDARGDLDGAAGKGIFIDVADDADGLVHLVLEDVAVSDVAGHGIHVSDCSLADDCGAGGGGAGDGSAASIAVTLSGVMVENVGQGSFDADGLRVDERGSGSIFASISRSVFRGVGADGVELDEGQAGGVNATTRNSDFIDNGDYCDPERLGEFMPSEPEGAFDQGAMTEADIPGPVTGSPDDACFEREVETHEDGSVAEYEFGIDVDDAFDIDEAGDGDLVAVMLGGTIAGNLDEGADFDEEDAGAIIASFIGVTASGNADDAFKSSEEGPGDVIGLLHGGSAEGNGGKGAVFEEAGDGNVQVTATGFTASGNDDGDGTGIEALQEDAGDGTLEIAGKIADGIDAEGVEVAQN